jgi:hypothetical protein
MGKIKRHRKKINRKKSAKTQLVNGRSLRAALAWAVDGKLFSALPFHGNTSWQITELILLAVLWVWSDNATLTGAFAEADRWVLGVLTRSVLGTYQGFMNALVRWTQPSLALLRSRLHQLMEEYGGEHFRIRGWVPIAADGSRVSVPRTQENEAAFCAKNYGRGRTAKSHRRARTKAQQKRYRQARNKRTPQRPQMWLTLLWHMGLKMPWSWRRGATDSSERKHVEEMLAEEQFPENTLFCCDAGFVGYELWKTLMAGGHDFLIRVGGNVRLIEELGYYAHEQDGIVYVWPNAQQARHQAPLVLRLIQIRIGKADIALVTNVLSGCRLTANQAKTFYQMRWGVELQFRTLKQTFERRVLRSRTPARARVELDWSLLGLWLVQLLAIKKQIRLGRLPERCSAGLAINVVREIMKRSRERPDPGCDLDTLLGAAVKDEYKREKSKQSRYKPDSARKPSCGQPEIAKATEEQKRRLKKILENAA